MWGGHCGEPRKRRATEDLALGLAWSTSRKVRSQLLPTYFMFDTWFIKFLTILDMTVFHDLPFRFRRGSSSTTDLNRRASTSGTGSEWGSSSDDQEPDVERTTALIQGEAM